MSTPRRVPALLWPSDAQLVMPGSKSSANRQLVIAAMAGHAVAVHGVPPSDDVRHMVAGLRTLGYSVQHDEATGVAQVGPRGADAPTTGVLHCGNAGTTLRFLVSVAALTPGEWTLTGDAAMQRRPIAPLVDAWRQLGVTMRATDGCPPVLVQGREQVRGGTVRLDASQSSQFVSSLLLVASQLQNAWLEIDCPEPMASHAYAEMTAHELRLAGVQATLQGPQRAVVQKRIHAVPPLLETQGDWSSAGIWTCLNHLTGSRVQFTNLPRRSGQPDEALAEVLQELPARGEHTIDVAAFPDQFLNLAVVAAHRAGTTRLVGGANLRIKECDRIAVMARELTRLGVRVAELDDGLVVHGGRPLLPGIVDPANDHRVAMAFALAGLLSPGIAIASPECVTKSYPRFWNDLDIVVAHRRCVAVVGMRAAGKSTFARALAKATESVPRDTDARFRSKHGDIAAFVARHGWPAFREHEAAITAAALQPGAILATGGGAIESASTRGQLCAKAAVVWLTAPAGLLRDRIATDATQRPSVTGAPVLDEIDELLARRRPLYSEVAHVRIDAALPTHQQVAQALRELGTSCRWPGSGDSAAAAP